MNYSLSQIATICSGKLLGNDSIVNEVYTDSRNMPISDTPLFIAISGCNHDGHSYIDELYSKGMRAFMVENDVDTSIYRDAGFIFVDDTISALQSLASSYREEFKGEVIAITGSNGKTIVKEWTTTLLSKRVKVFRSPRSYNSQIGVPLSILMIKGDEDIAIIEAGISKYGEMVRLESVIKPTIGVITTIGDAHQENFVSVESKIKEKTALFKGCKTIIYNGTYKSIEQVIISTYKDKELIDCSINISDVSIFTDKSSQENSLTALAICRSLGYADMDEFLNILQPIAMRLELKEGVNNSLVINDSYNSDINSLSIALDHLSNVSGNRERILILSDILQSGYSDSELYIKVAELINRSKVSRLIGIGDKIREYSDLFLCPSEFYQSTEAYLSTIKREGIADKVILLKGNRASHFERISHYIEKKSHTTLLEVNLDSMIQNLNFYRSKIKSSTKIMAMVKASGYGYGTFELANMLQHQGVNYLAVAFADEGITLRERGISMPIVVLNADADSFDVMITHRLEPEIYSFSSLNNFIIALQKYGERDYPIHIKLDTGMHRLGFTESDLPRLYEELNRSKELIHISSVFSHLAVSEDESQDEFTTAQVTRFECMTTTITEVIGYYPLRHIANSAAIERQPNAEFDMVRLGIGLYGVSSSGSIKLSNVSTLKTRIVQIKELDKDETIGYGRAGHIECSSRIATIPIGYADGLNRRLGCGEWSVRVNGKSAPIIGRICMDTCMINITGIDCNEGDEVIIFGSDDYNKVSDMAKVLGTIPYEIMTSISTRVKRIYTKE